MESKEQIICAATWFDTGRKHNHQPKNIESGMVVMALNHAMVYATIGGSVAERHQYDIYEKEQGFVTSHKRFVDRFEALEIAKSANQIVHKHGNPTQLYSEDLFDSPSSLTASEAKKGKG